MNRSLIFLWALLLLGVLPLSAQENVIIEDASANVLLKVAQEGVTVRKLTTTERTNVAAGLTAVDNGLLVFDATENCFYVWVDPNWVKISTGNSFQTLELMDNILSITDGNSVDLSNLNVNLANTNFTDSSIDCPTELGRNGLVDRIEGVAVSGNYAYVNERFDDRFQVIDITDPTNPTSVGSLTPDGSGDPIPDGNLVYVRDNGGSNDQIITINVSNPSMPTTTGLGSIDFNTVGQTGGDFDIRDMDLLNGKLVAVGSEGIFVFATDANTPNFVGKLIPGFPTTMEFYQDVVLLGNFAYVIKQSPPFSGPSRTFELVIIDISNPASPSITNTFPLGLFFSVDGIATSDQHIYLTREEALNDPRLTVIDVSNPNMPQQVNDISLAGNNVGDIKIQDGLAYVDLQTGLAIYDLSDPANPSFIKTINEPSTARFGLDDRRLVIAANNNTAPNDDIIVYDLCPSSNIALGVNPLTNQIVASPGANLNEVLQSGNSAGNSQIKNLTDPTDAQDAATKSYVDGVLTTATSQTFKAQQSKIVDLEFQLKALRLENQEMKAQNKLLLEQMQSLQQFIQEFNKSKNGQSTKKD